MHGPINIRVCKYLEETGSLLFELLSQVYRKTEENNAICTENLQNARL